ncbi:MAG: hypothetical protein ACOYEW_14770 [Anaerolineae bacterium]|jgi:hypothetical protein
MDDTTSQSVIPDQPIALSERLTAVRVLSDHPLAVAEHGESLVLMVADWPGDAFTLWFPESINVPEVGCMAANWRRSGPINWRVDPRSRTLWHTDQGSAYAYRARVWARGATLLMRLSLRNCGEDAWSSGWLNICLRMCHAAGFIDTSLGRTQARFSGEWKSLASLLPTGDVPSHMLVEGPCATPYYRESLRQWADYIPEARADAHEVIRVSHDGERAVVIRCTASAGLVANLADNMHCLHSNPAIPRLAPHHEAEIDASVEFLSRGLCDRFPQVVGPQCSRGRENA